MPWEPRLSPGFRRAFKMDQMGALGQNRGGGGSAAGTGTTGSLTGTSGGPSDMSALTQGTGSVEDLLTRLLSQASGAGTGGGRRDVPSTVGGNPPTEKGATDKNLKYHEGLFSEFRDRLVNGKPVKMRNIRNKIKNKDLPELPKSKVTGRQMCGGYHIKGICNTNCPEFDDHTCYTVEEYQPLRKWCVDNFPRQE